MSDERGSITLPAVASLGLVLVAFVVVAQFASWQYARGALRAAAQEAAADAAVLASEPGRCEATFDAVRADLLGGSLGAGVGPVRCDVGADIVVVEVDARFDSWLPFVPDGATSVRAVAVREQDPE